MDIKNMPLVDDLAQSIDAVKEHLPAQTAKDLSGIMERCTKLKKFVQIGSLGMVATSVVAIILSGIARYFAPSSGIGEFDVPQILIEGFASASRMGPLSIADSVSGVGDFISGPVMKTMLLVAMIGALAMAVVRQTLTPLVMVGVLAGSTQMLGPVFNILSPEPTHSRAERSVSDSGPREKFEIAIKEQDTATLREMLTDSSPAGTYLKAQIALKDGMLTSTAIGEAAKAIALGDLGFSPNNQVAYAIEHAVEVKQLSAAARAYADPANAKSALFSSLSHWVGIAALMFGLPSVAVGLLHFAILRRIRRIGQLSAYLLGH
ncbi:MULTISPECIES: hypothetical protein [unclassified Pseudomonas]|uniref:hypothetical protein n=1 Tax=unclassified Pseudomonas TaxID=196821 RepID=UPI001CC1405D|nr:MULTISPECIES: hypothetical protein [unclassified Pseudomonas]